MQGYDDVSSALYREHATISLPNIVMDQGCSYLPLPALHCLSLLKGSQVTPLSPPLYAILAQHRHFR